MEGKKEKRPFVVFLGEMTPGATRGQRAAAAANPRVGAPRGLNVNMRGAVGMPGSEETGLPPGHAGGPRAIQRQGCGGQSGGHGPGMFPTRASQGPSGLWGGGRFRPAHTVLPGTLALSPTTRDKARAAP